MTSPTKRTTRNRAGLVVLSVLVLAGTGAVAWAHTSPSASIPDPADGRIHACFPTSGTRTLRVVAPTQTCASNQSGVDWPANGVLTRLEETNALGTPLNLPSGGPGKSDTMTLTCPAGKVTIGLSEFSMGAPTAPAALVGIVREGTPVGNVMKATFATLTASAATVTAKALCVTLFAQ